MERAHKYEFEGKVRYSEIDRRATMTLPALINYFQDCSTFQSEQLGYGMDVLKKEKKAWVLAYWQVIVKRYPKLCERITVGTFASGFKGMFGNRNFYMKDESGEQIACANSIWVYMDVEKGKPVRVDKEQAEAYGIDEPLEMPYEDRKIEEAESYEEKAPFPVRKYHIDTNEHVNNCQYVQMAMDYLPENFKIHQMRAEYKQQARLNDVICPARAVDENKTTVLLNDQKGEPYAVVEFK